MRPACRSRVAGVRAPAFVERGRPSSCSARRPRVAGVRAPAFVERGNPPCAPPAVRVSPGFAPRPSLSAAGRRAVRLVGRVSPGFAPRPSLSVVGDRQGLPGVRVSPGFAPRPSLSVKRHPKLTLWRHRKLTPRRNGVCIQIDNDDSCGACGRRLRRPNRGGKRASRCGTPFEAPARVFHAGGRIHTTPGVDATLARVAWREGPRPCPPRCRPCGHRVRARARRGVGRVVTGSAPVPAAVSAAWSCRCPRAGPPTRQAPIPGSSGRPLDASPAAGSSRR